MSETQTTINHETFRGLAFPVARVRYAGPTDTRGSRYIASMHRDSERTYRATRSYEPGESGGASQAIHAATLCLAKALAENNPGVEASDYIAIPGDFSADSYVFTFVPAYFFSGDED